MTVGSPPSFSRGPRCGTAASQWALSGSAARFKCEAQPGARGCRPRRPGQCVVALFHVLQAIVNAAAAPGDSCASVAAVSCESCREGPDASLEKPLGQVLVRLSLVRSFGLVGVPTACCKSCSMYRSVVVRRRFVGLSVAPLVSSPQANASSMAGGSEPSGRWETPSKLLSKLLSRLSRFFRFCSLAFHYARAGW